MEDFRIKYVRKLVCDGLQVQEADFDDMLNQGPEKAALNDFLDNLPLGASLLFYTDSVDPKSLYDEVRDKVSVLVY